MTLAIEALSLGVIFKNSCFSFSNSSPAKSDRLRKISGRLLWLFPELFKEGFEIYRLALPDLLSSLLISSSSSGVEFSSDNSIDPNLRSSSLRPFIGMAGE
jgi:hypothetical protein